MISEKDLRMAILHKKEIQNKAARMQTYESVFIIFKLYRQWEQYMENMMEFNAIDIINFYLLS